MPEKNINDSKLTVKLFNKVHILISSFIYPPAAPLLVCINLLKLKKKRVAVIGLITIPFVSFLLVLILRRQETGSQAVEFLCHMTFYIVNIAVAAVLYNKYVEGDEVYIHAPETYMKTIGFGLLALLLFVFQVVAYKAIGRIRVSGVYLQADKIAQEGNFNASLAAFEKSYENAILFGDAEIEAVSLDRIAKYQLLAGNTDEALNNLTKALEIAKRANSIRAQMIVNNDFGDYYSSRKEYFVALGYKLYSLNLRDKDFQSGLAPSLTEIAVLYMKLLEYGSAITYYERALLRYRELGDEYQQAMVSVQLGDAYRQNGNDLLAQKFMHNSKDLFLKLLDTKRAEYVQGVIDRRNILSY